MKRHPEQRDGEIFLTNTTDTSMSNIGRKGKRLGTVAYDINGNKIGAQNRLFPVFCKPDPKLDRKQSE